MAVNPLSLFDRFDSDDKCREVPGRPALSETWALSPGTTVI